MSDEFEIPWKVVKAEDYVLRLEDPEGWYKASVKWDGCIGFRRYYNTPFTMRTDADDEDDPPDYLHICDVDDLIARLQALKVFAKQHFGEEWA